MYPTVEPHLKTFRVYTVIAGVLVILFWFIYRIFDPTIVDPLWIRIVLAAVTFTLLGLSYVIDHVRRRFPVIVKGLLCVYTAWIIGLNVANGFSPNYVVALLFVIAAIGVAVGTGLRRTEPVVYYLGFATLATAASVFATPDTSSGAVAPVIVIACVASMALVIYIAARASVRAQSELSAANEALVQRNRELQKFTSAASHDLREPLRKIQTFSDLLRQEHAGELSPESARYLGRIEAISRHMSGVISALLDFSHVSEETARFGEVDLNEIVSEVRSDLESELSVANAGVMADGLPSIVADRAQMRVLFFELFTNAITFRREGTPLEISISALEISGSRPPTHRIEVRDNGSGFEQKYASRIFAPFERLRAPDENVGAGMGLTICRRIVNLHGGRLTVESDPASGSLFIIEIPSRPSSARGKA